MWHRDCLAWLCVEGKIPYGIAQPQRENSGAEPHADSHQNSALITERLQVSKCDSFPNRLGFGRAQHLLVFWVQDAWKSMSQRGYHYLESMREGSKPYTATASFYASDALSCSEAASQGATGRPQASACISLFHLALYLKL